MDKPGSFKDLISALKSPQSKPNLADLLEIAPEEALKIGSVYSACEIYLRDALRQRLKHLCEHANKGQVLSFLTLIPRVDTHTPPSFEPLLAQRPELQSCITVAKLRLLQNPEEVLEHIDGVRVSGDKIKAGGHVLSAFETLADVAVSKMPKAELALFNATMAKLDPDKMRIEVDDMYGCLGFDLSGDRWRKFFLLDQTLWKIADRENGVRCFRVPRRYFNKQGWGNTVNSASYGISPVGGKSLFPSSWSQSDMVQSVLAVLEHPEALVLRRGITSNGQPKFFLRARIKNVDVEVGFEGPRIGTTFPSWRQARAKTIGNAYVEWFMEWKRLEEHVRHCVKSEPLLKRVSLPNGFVEGYLGKCPAGLSESEWKTIELWLNPKYADRTPDKYFASMLQILTFDWLEKSRVIQEIEGVSGPVH
jgi:hypothetical protein